MKRPLPEVAMPDPYVLMFEEPERVYNAHERRLTRLCQRCTFHDRTTYGDPVQRAWHRCPRGENVFVVWEGSY